MAFPLWYQCYCHAYNKPAEVETINIKSLYKSPTLKLNSNHWVCYIRHEKSDWSNYFDLFNFLGGWRIDWFLIKISSKGQTIIENSAWGCLPRIYSTQDFLIIIKFRTIVVVNIFVVLLTFMCTRLIDDFERKHNITTLSKYLFKYWFLGYLT